MDKKTQLTKELLKTRRQLGVINRMLDELLTAIHRRDGLRKKHVDTAEISTLLQNHKNCIVTDLIEAQQLKDISSQRVQKCKQDAMAAMRDSQRIIYYVKYNVEE